eukprot:TRINITY_DN5584_c0_g2_i1.p1 TRINITY_DN5584_c0_g2~~TRINITY_DN5584_c0_g2_i1.p1  ORF type:complete len:211 (+),score=65.55 TRINITY_DN5584_c0_g2_i1:78-710(+)
MAPLLARALTLLALLLVVEASKSRQHHRLSGKDVHISQTSLDAVKTRGVQSKGKGMVSTEEEVADELIKEAEASVDDEQKKETNAEIPRAAEAAMKFPVLKNAETKAQLKHKDKKVGLKEDTSDDKAEHEDQTETVKDDASDDKAEDEDKAETVKEDTGDDKTEDKAETDGEKPRINIGNSDNEHRHGRSGAAELSSFGVMVAAGIFVLA